MSGWLPNLIWALNPAIHVGGLLVVGRAWFSWFSPSAALAAFGWRPLENRTLKQTRTGLPPGQGTRKQAPSGRATVLVARAKQTEASVTLDKVMASRDYRKRELDRISELVER
jgi:hypothetical protein